MKAFLIGSTNDVEQLPEFMAASAAIGAELAKRGHELIVCSERTNTIDCHAGHSYAQSGGIKMTVWRAASDFKQPFSDLTATPVARRQTKEHVQSLPQRWHLTHLHAMSDADVVVVMAGGRSATLIAHSALAMSTPVVAIASFGGAAFDSWQNAKAYYDIAAISQAAQDRLSEAWTDESAATIVDVGEALVGAKLFPETEKLRHVLLRFCLVVLLVVGWIMLLTERVEFGNDLEVFAALFGSCTMGALAHDALSIESSLSEREHAVSFLGYLQRVFTVSFVVALLYVFWSFVVSGEALPDLATPSSFQRVFIALSVIGVMCGMTLDAVERRLPTLLETTVRAVDGD